MTGIGNYQTLVMVRGGQWVRLNPGCPLADCDWGTSVTNMRADAPLNAATDAVSLLLGTIEHLQEDHGALLPGSDTPVPLPQAVLPLAILPALAEVIHAGEALMARIRSNQGTFKERVRFGAALDQLRTAYPGSEA